MKMLAYLFALLLPFFTVHPENSVLVGKAAPNFCSKAVIGTQIIDGYSLENLRGEYVVPLFTPLILHSYARQNSMLLKTACPISLQEMPK